MSSPCSNLTDLIACIYEVKVLLAMEQLQVQKQHLNINNFQVRITQQKVVLIWTAKKGSNKFTSVRGVSVQSWLHLFIIAIIKYAEENLQSIESCAVRRTVIGSKESVFVLGW
jgi:hypothetical protein